MTHLASLLRSYRKRSGLKLEEIAHIIGYGHGGEISRHERLSSLPSLRAALGYAALYRAPIQKLFPALFEEIRNEVEDRLASLIEEGSSSTAKGRVAAMIARKMEWAWERKNQDQASLFDPPEHA